MNLWRTLILVLDGKLPRWYLQLECLCFPAGAEVQRRLSLHWQCWPLLPAWLLPGASSGPCVWPDVSQSQQIKQRARGRFVISATEIHPEYKEVVTCPEWWLLWVHLLRLPVPVLENTHVLFNSLALCLFLVCIFLILYTYVMPLTEGNNYTESFIWLRFQCLKSSATIRNRVHSHCLPKGMFCNQTLFQCVSIHHLEFDGPTCAFKKPCLLRTYIKNVTLLIITHSVAVATPAGKGDSSGSCWKQNWELSPNITQILLLAKRLFSAGQVIKGAPVNKRATNLKIIGSFPGIVKGVCWASGTFC